MERSQRVKQQILCRIKETDKLLKSTSSPAEFLQLATHRFSYSKILAVIFEDSTELPRSHAVMSQGYFQTNCISQSFSHSMIAARSKALPLAERQKIELTLSKCCLLMDNHEQAIDRLQTLDKQLNYNDQSQVLKILEVQQLMVRCLTRKKDYTAALAKEDQYLEGCAKHFGRMSVEFALGLVERGTILASSEKYKEAEEHQQAAIDTLIAMSYNQVKVVSDLYVTLALYQKHNNNLDAEYSSLIKARNIYNERPEHNHKLIEVRHCLENNLEARGLLNECLKQCLEIKEMEKNTYGQITPQVGRTERRIGDIYLLLDRRSQAIQHYLKAIGILQENGQKKAVVELDNIVKGLREMKPTQRNLKSAMNRL